VTIPDSVTSIGSSVFRGCTSLTSIIVPNSVTTIQEAAFSLCTSLTNITVDAANADYSNRDGVLFNKDHTVIIQCPGGKAGTYTVPNSVTTIGRNAFDGCKSLTGITIPDSVTTIGGAAFYGCTSLTSVSIPDSVTSIGSWVFRECTSLTSVTIPDSVTSIGDFVFFGCPSLRGMYFQGNALSGSPLLSEPNDSLLYYLPWHHGLGVPLLNAANCALDPSASLYAQRRFKRKRLWLHDLLGS